MNLSKQLKFFLKARNLTAAELSRRSKVSKQVLSLWTNGAAPKRVVQVKQVADALGTTVDNLLFGDGKDLRSERVTELDALLGDGWVSGLFEVRFRRVRK